MTQATLETLREKLDEALMRLVEEIEVEEERRRALTSSGDVERYGNHPGDEGSETFEREKSLTMQNHLEVMLWNWTMLCRSLRKAPTGNASTVARKFHLSG